MCNTKVCLAAVWVVASIIFPGQAQANATGKDKKDAAAEGVTRLPFSGVAPLPGALSISADGRTAAHIGTNGDVVLWDVVNVKPLETIPADGKQPSAVALSPDGDLVAIGYFDSRVIVRSRREHKLLREFSGHAGGVSALAFSPEGRMLASGGDDATAQLWEVSSGRRSRVFDSQFGGSEHGGGIVVALGFSGNGRVLVVNEWYSRFYDVERGTTLWDIEEDIEISTKNVAPPNTDDVMRAGQALGGGGWLLAYTGNKGLMVERLDLCKSSHQLSSGRYAETVAADPQGRWVAASEIEKLTFFVMSGSAQGYSMALPSKAIALAAHPDGRSVFALMIDSTQSHGNGSFIFGRSAFTVTGGAIYRIAVPAPLWRLPSMVVKADATHCAPTQAVRMKQDFKLPEKSVELTVIAKLAPTKEMTTDPDDPTGKYNQVNPPRELYFASDGSLYALYHAESNFRSGVAVWNPQTKRLLHARFKRYVRDFNLRLREGWAGWAAGTETLNNLLTGKAIYQFRKDERPDSSASDRDTGEVYRIAAGHFERYAADGRRLQDVATGGSVVVFAARNGRLAVLYANGNVQVWQMQASGKSKTIGPVVNLAEDPCVIEQLALSADGRYLQIPFSCNDVPTFYRIYSLDSGRQVAQGALLAPFPGRANRGVVRDTRPHRLAVWDFDRGEIIARLPRHRSRDQSGTYKPLRAAISDDGRLLASASYDGLVRVWNLDTRQMLGEGRVDGTVTAMAFDAAGRQLAAGREDGHLLVFQVPEPK